MRSCINTFLNELRYKRLKSQISDGSGTTRKTWVLGFGNAIMEKWGLGKLNEAFLHFLAYYSSVSNSTGAMFIFLREKNGSTTRLQDTTIINFQEIVHSTRLL